MEEKLEKTLCKIAVVGPESTGKSIMASRLAQDFGTWYIPEYSRYYCEGLNNQYTLQDEVNIFYGQIALENAIIEVLPHTLVFCDTTILTVKIWSDYLFDYTPDNVLKEIRERTYDLYLLMDIDLPWVDDPLRDFPEKREYFLDVWKKELDDLGASYEVVRGIGENRFQNAKMIVSRFLKQNRIQLR